MATNDPIAELTAALRKRDQLHASLPDLRSHLEGAAIKRREAHEALERHEEDALIGKVSDDALKKIRARHDAAVLEHRKAGATAREAEETSARLDKVIADLTPAVRAARIAYFEARQKELAAQLAEGLKALVPINDALHANFREAEDEFPFYYVGRKQGKARPYPVAAGLQNLSWPELRHNPDAIDGGRLGCFLRAVDEFIDPQPPKPVRRAQPAPAPAAKSGIEGYEHLLTPESAAALRQEQGAK
jgi:hypothetical protein